MSKKIMVVCCVVGLIVSAVSVAVTGSGIFACCIAIVLLLLNAKYGSDKK